MNVLRRARQKFKFSLYVTGFRLFCLFLKNQKYFSNFLILCSTEKKSKWYVWNHARISTWWQRFYFWSELNLFKIHIVNITDHVCLLTCSFYCGNCNKQPEEVKRSGAKCFPTCYHFNEKVKKRCITITMSMTAFPRTNFEECLTSEIRTFECFLCYLCEYKHLCTTLQVLSNAQL